MKQSFKPNWTAETTQVCAAQGRLACAQVLAKNKGHWTAPLLHNFAHPYIRASLARAGARRCGGAKLRFTKSHKLHRTVTRPWGTYTTLQEGPRFKIKRIEVKPGARLPSQMHHHRSEHWVVVSGTARMTIRDKTFFTAPNESRYVLVGATHRLENPGKAPLVMIAVQCGDYVGEDDIVRFDDLYGRVSENSNVPSKGTA